MKRLSILAAAAASLTLSGCVVLDTAPPEAIGPGPYLTGGTAATAAPSAPPVAAPAAAPDLWTQLAGRTLSAPGLSVTLFGGGLARTTLGNGPNRETFDGSWHATDRELCFSIQSGQENCHSVAINGSTARLTRLRDGQVTDFSIL